MEKIICIFFCQLIILGFVSLGSSQQDAILLPIQIFSNLTAVIRDVPANIDLSKILAKANANSSNNMEEEVSGGLSGTQIVESVGSIAESSKKMTLQQEMAYEELILKLARTGIKVIPAAA